MHTTISDEERRDVARKLREIRPCKSGHIKWWEIARALDLKQPAGWFGWEKFESDSVNRLADLIEPDDPPYNLYTLYEAVFHRSPRCWECIEDDEVDELVDALLDICNAPGHERIQRLKPPYPDATAIYKGWRAEVYDPDGVLVSPSNLAVDLVRAHEYGKGLGVDRDALLKLAGEMKAWALTCDHYDRRMLPIEVARYARRIREACGEVDE